MTIIRSIRNGFPTIHPEGYPIIIISFICSIVLGWIWNPLFWIGIIFTIWCIFFFRDPKRIIPVNSNFVVSPADGLISFVGLTYPPKKLQLLEEEMMRISIFMDIFSCHINRIPINGIIKSITYFTGKFSNAEFDNSYENNEQNCLIVESLHGDIGIIQIAGLIARRIVCWVKPEEKVISGQRFGLIRFGSRLDIYLPSQCKVQISTGQRSIAGETILANFEKNLPDVNFRID